MMTARNDCAQAVESGTGREGEAEEVENLEANNTPLGSIPSWRDCHQVALSIKAHPANMKYAAERSLLAMMFAFLKRQLI